MKPMLGDETEDQNPGASFAALDQTAGMSDADAAKKVRLINGLEKVKAQQIKRWREAAAQEERSGKRAKRGGVPPVPWICRCSVPMSLWRSRLHSPLPVVLCYVMLGR